MMARLLLLPGMGSLQLTSVHNSVIMAVAVKLI